MLPQLPYQEWEPTKTTLHLYAQIVGKIQLASTHHKNHWWNATLLASTRGLRTHRMHSGETYFEIELDLVEHRLQIRTTRAREPFGFPLRDGLSVAEFYDAVLAELRKGGIDVKIHPVPYGIPITTPFHQDREHRSYDGVMARRFWEVVIWSSDVMDLFASRFAGKQSPAQVFWHSFDLAMARFSGKRVDTSMRPDFVQKEAYSHEVISFGFWAGDANVPAPTYYTYTAPEPATLAQQTLAPMEAAWAPSGGGHMGVLPYEIVRAAVSPEQTLLDFYQSGYDAGTRTASWDAAALKYVDPRTTAR